MGYLGGGTTLLMYLTPLKYTLTNCYGNNFMSCISYHNKKILRQNKKEIERLPGGPLVLSVAPHEAQQYFLSEFSEL